MNYDPRVGLDLLRRVLSGDPIDLAEITNLVEVEHSGEGFHLDYKAGAVIGETGKTIAKAVAALANGDGGVVVIGANGGDAGTGMTPWSMAPCPPRVGRQPAREWVEGALVELAPYLRPPPRVRAIGDNGEVILVGVPRADTVVPMVVPRHGIVHYVRFFDQSHPLPPYLVADLVAGRRRAPVLSMTVGVERVGPADDRPDNFVMLGLSDHTWDQKVGSPWPVAFHVTPRNAGLTWADAPQIGVVGPVPDNRKGASLTSELAANVRIEPAAGFRAALLGVFPLGDLAPFAHGPPMAFTLSGPSMAASRDAAGRERDAWYFAEVRRRGQHFAMHDRPHFRVTCRAALWVACRNGVPDWHQIEIVYNETPEVEAAHVAPAARPVAVGITFEWLDPATEEWVAVEGYGPTPLAPAR